MRAARRLGCLFLMVFILASCGGNPAQKKKRYLRRGEEALKQGDYRRAEVNFRRALQIDPRLAPAYYGLGVVYFKEGRIPRAYGALVRAVEISPDLLPARILLGRIFLLVRKPDKALAEAEYVLSKDPARSEAKLLKAAALLGLRKYDRARPLLEALCGEREVSACLMLADLNLRTGRKSEAERVLRRVLEFRPNQPRATLLLARILEGEGKYSQAEALYRSLYEAHPDDFRYLEGLVRFYQRRRNLTRAIRVLRDGLARGVGGERAYLLLAQVYALAGEEGQVKKTLEEGCRRFPQSFPLLERLVLYSFERGSRGEAYRLLEAYISRVDKDSLKIRARLLKATLLWREGRLREALREVDGVLEDSPHLVSAHLLKGDILFRRGDYTGAIGEYRAALGEEPQNPGIMLRLARAHLLNREPDLAEDMYRRVLEVSPENREAYLGLAEVYVQEGNPGKARALLEERWKKDPGDLIVVEKLVDLYLQEKDRAAARRLLEKTLALNPRHPLVLTVLARIVRKAGLTREMIAYCRKLSLRDPRPFYLLLLAQLYGETGDYARAIALYRRVLEKNPRNLVAANNLAFYLAQYQPTPRNLAEAERLLLPWVRKYPRRTELVDTLAWIKYRKGDYAGARALLEKLGDKVRDYPVVSYHLGAVYYQLGERSRALVYLRLALERGREFAGREEARRLLAELEKNP